MHVLAHVCVLHLSAGFIMPKRCVMNCNLYVHYNEHSFACRTMPHSQQNNFDDCGVFALLFANQLAIGADLNLIQPNRVAQFRIYITLCFLEQLQPSLVIDHSREANHSEASGMAGVYAEIHGPCGFPPGTPRVPTYVYTYVHCNCS